MLKVYDYRCPQCDHAEERMVKQADADTQLCRQHLNEVTMLRLPPGTRTTFRFADQKLKQ